MISDWCMQLCCLLSMMVMGLGGCVMPAVPVTDQEKFASFMQQHWGPLSGVDAAPEADVAVHRGRRAALGAAHLGTLLVIPTGHVKYRSNDTAFDFRPGSNFYYLTGSREPDSVLVMAPLAMPGQKRAVTHEAILFTAPTFDPNDARFYKDTRDGALWVGPRLGLAASLTRYGVDHVRPLSTLADYLQSSGGLFGPKVATLRGADRDVDAAVAADIKEDAALARSLAKLRLIKDAGELAALRNACAVTHAGFTQALAAMPRATSEHALAVAFKHVALDAGNGVGYLPIVGAGPHATILHWHRNDGPLDANQLVLMDAGVEDRALYTSDITRTFPVSGRFSPAHRQLYEIVLAAQRASLAAIHPGAAWGDVGKASTAVLKAGLVELNVLQDANDTAPMHQRYTLHGVSHMLGLDVHDPDGGKDLRGDGVLRAGMVFTVEPGLYFQANDLTVPEPLRGLGVRIEDDIVVTDSGYELLCDIPREADAVQDWIKAAWAAPG